MKIVVAHSDRQHSHALLRLLHQKGWLQAYFTLFSGNKLGWLRHLFPRSIRDILRKRSVDEALTPLTRHFPGRFIAGRLAGRDLIWAIRHTYVWFDRAVARRLKHEPFDLIITYENANLHTLRAAKDLGKTTVLDLAQIHPQEILDYGKWFMPPAQLQTERDLVTPRKTEALGFTDYVITLSTFAAETMLRHGWPAERLFTVNLGIDPERFTPKQHYRSEGPLKLLFVGTITKRKGLHVLFEAMAQLPEEDFDLTLIGPVADASDLLEKNAARCRHIPFLHHEKLVSHYQDADVFVFPSLLDAWAQTVVEAMACGTPVIVTQNTGARDVVGRGGGWIIPPNDAGALRRQLVFCRQNRTELAETGRIAHRLAQDYTWAHYNDQLAAVLTEIARRAGIETP